MMQKEGLLRGEGKSGISVIIAHEEGVQRRKVGDVSDAKPTRTLRREGQNIKRSAVTRSKKIIIQASRDRDQKFTGPNGAEEER